MKRSRKYRNARNTAYVLSAIVALSMILALVGPILMGTPSRPTLTPTSTWPPTWTPRPTRTPTPSPTPSPTPAPTQPPASTTPVTTTSSSLIFAVCGDSRDNPQLYKELLERVTRDGNAFLIHLGDLVGRGTEASMRSFHNLMADFALPFYPLPGNHDRDYNGALDNFLRFSGAPAVHYSFDAGPVHFTLADSSSGSLDKDELAWIDRDLASTGQALKMVFMHHPPFDPDGSNHILYAGSDEFMALMRRHQVAYVFTAHIHAYGREVRDGTVYVVTGGAGAPLYTRGHPNAFYHYIRVTVKGNRVKDEVIRLQ